MKVRNLFLVLVLTAGLAPTGVWCAGACCETLGGGEASPISFGAVSCCGAETPSPCQPSIQRDDGAALAPAVFHAPLAAVPAQQASFIAPMRSSAASTARLPASLILSPACPAPLRL